MAFFGADVCYGILYISENFQNLLTEDRIKLVQAMISQGVDMVEPELEIGRKEAGPLAAAFDAAAAEKQQFHFPQQYGGEEFIAVVFLLECRSALQPGQEISRLVEAAALPNAHGRVVTISVGICHVGNTMDASVRECIKIADKALCQAQKRGKNRAVPVDAPRKGCHVARLTAEGVSLNCFFGLSASSSCALRARSAAQFSLKTAGARFFSKLLAHSAEKAKLSHVRSSLCRLVSWKCLHGLKP